MKRRAWLIVVGGLLAALVYAQLAGGGAEAFGRNPYGQALMQTYQLLQNQYLNRLEPNQLNRVLEGGIRGMLGALDDEFTSYAPPQRANLRNQDIQGEFFGIGATLSPNENGGGARVQGVIRGLPAFNAGIRVGDVIVEVDNEDVTKLDINEIVAKIRGPRDTKVVIGIRREGTNAILRFEMIRQRVEIISVSKTILPGNVGYVALETFGNVRVIEQLNAALNEMKQRGVQKLIFDLRDNGGGLLDQGCQVARAFIREGPIVYVRTRNETRLYCEATGQVVWSGPMVVLINGNSASASEIVAGAMQDTGRAKVIGETSFGKGVGQNVVSLANGGDLTLVTFEWLTPKRRSVHKQGIKPDLEVKDTRFEVPVSFEGAGAKPGETVTLSIGGQTFTTKADAQGKFSFSQPRPAVNLPAERGQAEVDLNKDAILRRALEELR
ncbi:S41 family peptidase [Meiothermus rufus]|uniref:S41 family peptidase n=1 Tax=Meiothermus rufus TaxID=604332 RepID=UPI0003F81388|nr:S41 family peptidase [Meiothermus rufus]